MGKVFSKIRGFLAIANSMRFVVVAKRIQRPVPAPHHRAFRIRLQIAPSGLGGAANHLAELRPLLSPCFDGYFERGAKLVPRGGLAERE